MHINIKDLSFKYNKNIPNVIDNLSLNIKEGTITVLVGLNGSGKTTLIKLLAGLLTADVGTIKYNDKEINSISIKERSKIFSYVPQRSYGADDFLVRDYLTYGFVNSLKFYETPNKEQLSKVEEISKELGIENLLDKKIGNISGGERQIVTIASCILQNAPVILLDEPTSALDLKNQNMVLNLLKKISNEGRTIILSSHNPNHALFLGSNVALMNNGKIIKSGRYDELINVEALKEIYGDTICYSDDLPYKEITFKN